MKDTVDLLIDEMCRVVKEKYVMPVSVKKTKGGKYQVSTPNMVHAKGTTKAKAEAQERLLNAIENDPKFKPRKK